jgi:large subunit ribosomal protein L13
MSTRTYSQPAQDVERRWHLVDAEGIALGRLATVVAQLIRGKHKPTFTPHIDGGDFVVVINAAKVRLTGRKREQKRYFRHSGYMGHERFTPVSRARPERVVEHAVFGMLPKTTLSRQRLRHKLRVYAGPEHPHAAQQPSPVHLRKPRAVA